ncbi:MAG: hypothetical protein ACLUAR_20185 [Pilosibacter sp.]
MINPISRKYLPNQSLNGRIQFYENLPNGKEKSQNIRVLIATIKVRMNYDNAKMAKCLGLKLSLPARPAFTIHRRHFAAWELLESHAVGKVPDSEKANYL